MQANETCTLRDGTALVLRPVAASDDDDLARLIAQLSPRDRRWRFHGALNGLTPARLRTLTQPGAGSVALVATVRDELVADVRCVVDATGTGAEFALMVASAWRRRGVARLCMSALSRASSDAGLRWLHGAVMADNAPMLSLMRRCGFLCTPSRHASDVVVVERLVTSRRPQV